MSKAAIGIAAVAAMIGTPVLAADMALKAPPPPPAWSWTGFYVGLNAGYSWSRVTTTTTTDCPAAGYYCAGGAGIGLANVAVIDGDGSGTFNRNAFTGGAQAGYNWQSGNGVVGVEADVEALRAKVSTTVARIYPSNLALTYVEGTRVSTDWLSTWRGRAGWANDKVLLYATGGLALTDITVGDTFSDNLNFGGAPGAVGGSSTSKLKAGWTVGAGLEYALSRNWSVRGEYLYVDLGSVSTSSLVTHAGLALANTLSISGKVTSSIARGALNYRF